MIILFQYAVMALANGLSSQLLQSLSPGLVHGAPPPQAELPAKMFTAPVTASPHTKTSHSLSSSPFSLSSILQDKTESIQDLRFVSYCWIFSL